MNLKTLPITASRLFGVVALSLFFTKGFSQGLKAKLKKDNTEAFTCGYVHVPGLKEKANPMRALQKSMGGAATKGSNPNLGTAAISIFYQAHLHPENIMRYPTKNQGWETCGDAVFAGFTNKSGVGLSSTDGKIVMKDVSTGDESEVPYAGIGTYFNGFKPEKRGTKTVTVTSSESAPLEVTIEPGLPLEIKTINGKPKGEEVLIDGTEDVIVELVDGDADPSSYLHVQLICKLVGTPLIYDVMVTKARNTIRIPKEAFKNFEGSPSPFVKNNTLIVNRVTEKIIDNKNAGALRTISAYMDWCPVALGGDLTKGNVLTMGFDSTKNTRLSLDLITEGEYNFSSKKGQPFTSPPSSLIKNVAIASFVVRGNLSDKDISSGDGWTMETTKWFPDLSQQVWQRFADQWYASFATQTAQNLGWNILPLSTVVNASAYQYAKPIQDNTTRNYVEVGAGGTKRILTTSMDDVLADLSISFPGDFVSERLIKEL
ncbi:MAG: hypothetical protein JJ975_16270, partial [Bacteroidia bacterium]|nr:hypothetical protein [Bacteroidia bacterium]